MKFNLRIIIFFIIIASVLSCKQKQYYVSDFATAQNYAKLNNKKLWVMFGGGTECRACNNIFDKLEKEKIFEKYKNDYVFLKCNLNDSCNQFMHYILLIEQIPNNYIFNEDGELVFASFNGETTSKIDDALCSVLKGKKYHNSQVLFPNLDSEQLLLMHNYTINAYLTCYYKKDYKNALDNIDASLNIQPYFYNIYLKSCILDKMDDKIKADSCAKIAISYYMPGYQALVYQNIYESLTRNIKDTLNKEEAILSVKDSKVDVGNIKLRRKFILKIELVNSGNKPLLIFAVKGNCGCIVTEYNKKPILPNENSEITISYTPEELGPFVKTIHVLTNSKQKIEEITFSGITK